MSLSALHNYSAVQRFFESARRRRVDIAYIGDSNAYVDGYGEKAGWQAAYAARFRQYATGVMAGAANGGYIIDSAGNSLGAPVGSSIPSTHAQLAFTSGNNPIAPCYLPAGPSSSFSTAFAYIKGPESRNLPLSWVFDYLTFSSGSGIFQPTCRYEGQLSYAAIGTQFNTNTGTDGHAIGKLSIPAGDRGASLLLMQAQVHEGSGFNPPSTIQAQGPFGILYHRTVWDTVNSGISVNTLFYAGGQPTRAAALNLQAMTQTQFSVWVANVVGQQQADPMLMVQIVEGGNDLSDGSPGNGPMSVGPNPQHSDTAGGVVDNHEAIVLRLRALWVGAGYDARNLFFMLGPYHPAEESRLLSKRQIDDAMDAYSDRESNVGRASDSRISSSAYFRARNWYLGGPGDDAHLNNTGHEPWALMALDTMIPPAAAVARLTSGSHYYAVLFDDAVQPLDMVNHSYGPLTDALWPNYALGGEELGTTGLFRFVLPAWVNRQTLVRGIVFARSGNDADKTDQQAYVIPRADFDGVRSVALPDAPDHDPSASLTAIQSKTDLITTEGVRYIGAYANGVVTLRRGDSYGLTTGRTLVITLPQGESWPALTDGWVVVFTASLKDLNGATGTTSLTKPAVIVDDVSIRVDLASAETATLDLGPCTGTGSKGGLAWEWKAKATKGSLVNTLIAGSMSVL